MAKCPTCNGTGRTQMVTLVQGADFPCIECNGTGEVEMTNEYFLRTATTEQLAEFLYDIAYFDNWSDAIMNDSLINETAVEDAIEKWLKQPHQEKE